MYRKIIIGLGTVAAIVGLLCSNIVHAQGFPTRPVRLIVPFPPGGVNDLVARVLANGLSSRLGQPVVVETKPGASTSIGTDFVAKSAPDGHTLLLGSISAAVSPTLMKTPWDPVRDLTAAAYLGVASNILVVHPSVPANNVKELVAYAKRNPGLLNFGNPGNGTSLHLSAELLQSENGIKLTSIGYKGSPPSIPDFLSGRLQVGIYPYSVIISYVQSGKARAIAVYAPSRLKQLPEVPTMEEQGFKSSQVTSWFALLAPKATPFPVIERINRETNAVLADPANVTALEALGFTGLEPWSAQQTTDLLARETKRWAKFIPTMGIKSE